MFQQILANASTPPPSLSILMLSLSLGALVLAPLVFSLVRRHQLALPALDGFVLASVGGLLMLHVLPLALAKTGLWAVIVGFLGLVTPLLVERFAGLAVERVHTVTVALAMVGLALHSAADGVALHTDLDHQMGLALPLAVVLHRLPVGLVVWSLVRPKHGVKWAVGVLSLIGVATMLGFGFSAGKLQAIGGFASLLFQTFVAGSLLHVLVHVPLHSHEGQAHDHDHGHGHEGHGQQDHGHGDRPVRDVAAAVGPQPVPKKRPWAETLGALVGVAFIAIIPLLGDHSDDTHLLGYGRAFLHLALESAPALLLGYLLAGVFIVFLPAASASWIARGGPLSQAARGVIFGVPIPICSCGVVPVYQSLVRRGIPATAGMAFLVATPELGIESFLLSFPLLGVPMTLARLLAALVVALAAGYLVGRLVGARSERASEAAATQPAPLLERIKRSLAYGFGETVDATASWILVGLAVAAALQPSSLSAWLRHLPAGLDVVIFGLAGIPIYVCASGATPLAAALIFAGASPGAALAFLLAGPATNITTFGVLTQLHSRRIALLFGATVLTAALAVGYLTNLVMPASWVRTSLGSGADSHGIVSWLALGVLALVFLGSLYRTGPRAALAEVLQTRGGHSHPRTAMDGGPGEAALDGCATSHEHGGDCCGSACASAASSARPLEPVRRDAGAVRVSLVSKKSASEKA